MADINADSLAYHIAGRPGKLEVLPCKPCTTQHHLSMAYTPGVAATCRAIQADPDKSFDYTNRGNLVGVVSNGTAVLGLGDIGPLAGKPVMEGKALLFKVLADIDCYTVDINEKDPDRLIETVRRLEPTFGGINLEDIKAPECFKVEATLKSDMNIPVFHDDQHGTAVISGAALLNALDLIGKRLDAVTVVVSGAGAAGIACSRFYHALGVPKANLKLIDTKGLVHAGRKDLNPEKQEFAQAQGSGGLAEAMRGADVFLGCSAAGVLTADMVKTMAAKPIIFACANPDPEIPYPVARAARPDAIVATGRSDYPNQVNNALGFPFIFRGALDVRARSINEPMKIAAARALAALAREPVPAEVCKAYGGVALAFGPDYLIPKPLDPRVIAWEATAVAEAAMATGVARRTIDLNAYRASLGQRLAANRARIQTLVGSYQLPW